MNSIRGTVVVGVDGSETALRAVRWAAAEAERRGVPLRLINAFDWTRDRMVGLPGLGEQDREIRLDVARRTLTRAAAVAEAEVAGIAVEQQVIVGFPAEVLALAARQAQLLVIGDNGHGRLDGMLAGSVAVAMATRAPCPVVVVRGLDAAGPSLPVVVGVDGSAASEAAVAFAMDAASTRHVSVVAVHSWHEPMMVDAVMAQAVDQRDQQQRQLTQKMAGWADKYPGVFVESLVTRDPPARSLLDRAQRAQLVVVGTRGHGELAGMILGSVSNALLHRCPCPVAVVRPDAAVAG